MTVKAIGTRNPKHIRKTSCEHCAADLEYVKNDILISEWKDYDGGGAGMEYITCPVCSKNVRIRVW